MNERCARVCDDIDKKMRDGTIRQRRAKPRGYDYKITGTRRGY